MICILLLLSLSLLLLLFYISTIFSCVVVINKCIIQIILTFCFQLKYELSIHNIAFSSKSVISSETGEKYAQIKHHLQAKTVQNPSNKYGGFWCGFSGFWCEISFSMEEVLWINTLLHLCTSICCSTNLLLIYNLLHLTLLLCIDYIMYR